MKKLWILLLCLPFWNACKVDPDFDGPDLNDLYGPFALTEGLNSSRDSVDFASGESVLFTAGFSKRVDWTIGIKGLTSGAHKEQKEFGSLVAFDWKGETTFFPMFRSEWCAVELTVENQPDTLRDTVYIVAPKVNNGFLLSDFEMGLNPSWQSFIQSGQNMNFGLLNSGDIPQGQRAYSMGGTVTWDWLIGMIDIPASAYGLNYYPLSSNANNVYFNMLMKKPAEYDNGVLLLRFMEDDNEDGSFTSGSEDMYAIEIKGGPDGWRLVSLKYNDIKSLVNGVESAPDGNAIHEPNKLFQVSMLFLANPASGYSETAIDYVMFTEGSPLAP
jgi:hypothetical protein